MLCRRSAADALAQRVQQVDHVLAAGTLFRGNRFAGALLVDEFNEGGFVLIFDLRLGLSFSEKASVSDMAPGYLFQYQVPPTPPAL